MSASGDVLRSVTEADASVSYWEFNIGAPYLLPCNAGKPILCPVWQPGQLRFLIWLMPARAKHGETPVGRNLLRHDWLSLDIGAVADQKTSSAVARNYPPSNSVQPRSGTPSPEANLITKKRFEATATALAITLYAAVTLTVYSEGQENSFLTEAFVMVALPLCICWTWRWFRRQTLS